MIKKTLSDEQLVVKAQQAKRGGERIVGDILSKYAVDGRYISIAKRILHKQEDAEDAVQNALVLALRKWRQFRGASKFSTWFTRIVITSALMLRRSQPDAMSIQDAPFGVPDKMSDLDLEAAYYQDELRAILHKAAAGLEDEHERAIIKLRIERELSFKQISSALNIPLGTVKLWAVSAYKHLEEAVEALM